MSRPLRSSAAALLLLCTSALASAATQVTDSLEAFQAAINAADPGDTIVLKSGVYTTLKALTVKRAGTAERPIVIAAEAVGSVELRGTHGFNVVQPAAHVVIRGFLFTHASGRTAIAAGTRHVRFTRNTFVCTGDGPYLAVAGDDAEVDYNEFKDKKTVGNMLSVTGTGAQVARRLRVHHNYFHDFANAWENGAETIRFGLSSLSLSTGQGIVEHNLFVRCKGENELISNKSSGNTYRYNTIIDSQGAQLTLRHGNECVVYGNYFRNTEGLRIFGDRHRVHSNYFEGNYLGINLGNGGAEVADGAPLTSHDRPDDCIIVFNTLVNNRTHYQMSRRTPTALGATNTVFAHNLLVGGGTAAKIEGPNPGAVWTANLLWNVPAGDLPAGGYTKADPLLAPGPDGVHRLQPGSPAIDAVAATAFPFVTTDLDGQPRTEKLDTGADEFSPAPVAIRILTPADVGPQAPEPAP
jgi:poly(beta-D-mannuronate) lyase